MGQITDSDALTTTAVEETAASPWPASTRPPGISNTTSNTTLTPAAALSERTVRYISDVKKEDPWIREFRLNALRAFMAKPLPTHWATRDLENLNFDKIRYYLSQGTKPKRTWDEVPADIKMTFERLGVPEQERKFLAGVEAQFDSEAAYSNIKMPSRSRESSSSTRPRRCARTPRSSAGGSARSSPPATTSSPP